MTLVRVRPWLRDSEFENAINNFFNDISTDTVFSAYPKVDFYEDDKAYYFNAELPGVSKDDIKLVIEDGILTLSGEFKNGFDGKEDINYLQNERFFGKFERKFNLADNVDYDKVEAKFENGLLKVKINKIKPEQPKERIIKVK